MCERPLLRRLTSGRGTEGAGRRLAYRLGPGQRQLYPRGPEFVAQRSRVVPTVAASRRRRAAQTWPPPFAAAAAAGDCPSDDAGRDDSSDRRRASE